MPSSAILRASSEACGCAKSAGNTVEPVIPGRRTGTVQLLRGEPSDATEIGQATWRDILICRAQVQLVLAAADRSRSAGDGWVSLAVLITCAAATGCSVSRNAIRFLRPEK